MSTESAILLAVLELKHDLAELRRSLDLLAGRISPAPDRLRTREACDYLGITDSTLHRWRERGLVIHHGGPRPWDRRELELALRQLARYRSPGADHGGGGGGRSGRDRKPGG